MSFTGAGGGGGGSNFKQSPDNLRSDDTFEGLLGLGIGPMKGPVNGLKSIKLDGTPLENETGTNNFGDFTAIFADGDPTKFPQAVSLKLGAGGSPQDINTQLRNTNTGAGTGTPGPWVTRTLTSFNADAIDLRFVVNQLYRQNKKGIYATTATIEVEMKPVGSTNWINPIAGASTATYDSNGFPYVNNEGANVVAIVSRLFFDVDFGGLRPSGSGGGSLGSNGFKINAKRTGPSVFELRIAVPKTGAYANIQWDVRARLLERENYEADPDFEKRQISWESMTAVFNTVYGTHEDWRGVSWLQLFGKASDQLSGVPEVVVEADTKIMQVPPPAIFNPETRVYTPGTWDGSWVKAYTNDPAWIINDAISDELAGLSLIAPGSYLNKWDALEASKWFSEQVPDGSGGFHPRYSLNLAVTDQVKAEEFIRYLAGAVGALAWDQGDGEWRMKVDKPETPVDIFTLDNIEGEFIYSHTDVDTRYNDITGNFKNAEMDYRKDNVHLYDNASIAQIGRKPLTIDLVGATNRQEAMRRVMLRLRSTVNETRIVNFTTNRRGRNVEMLDTILVADGDLGDQDKRTTGRVVSIAPDRLSITVRDDMRLETGVDYTLRFAVPNPEYDPATITQPTSVDWKKPTVVATRDVTNTVGQRGNVKIIYFDEALPEDLPDYLAVALEATNLPTLPKMYRVTNIVYDEDGERVALSAIEIDVGKWDASDNVDPDATVFQDLTGIVPPPLLPEGDDDVLTLLQTPGEGGVYNFTLMANWRRPANIRITGFRVRHRVNEGEWTTVVERSQTNSYDFVNPVPGLHEVEITSIDRRGNYSEPLTATFDVPAGLGATRNNWTGPWVAGTPYLIGDAFSYNGSSYVTVVEHTASAGDPPPNANVALMAAKGDQGVQGLPGVNGSNGVGAWTPSMSSTVTRNGSTFTKNGPGASAGYNAHFYSQEAYQNARAEWRFNSLTTETLQVGINTDAAAEPGDTNLDYSLGVASNGIVYLIINGVAQRALPGANLVTDTYGVVKRGANVYALRNGTVVDTFTTSADPNAVYQLDASMSTVGSSVTGVSFTNEGAQGTQGPQGIQGPAGANGNPTYIWFAYADSADGTVNFSNTDPGTRTYIGVAPNKTTSVESANPADYTWSKIQGTQGIQGPAGVNGQPTYIWVAYADSADGTVNFTTGAPGTRTYIGVAPNKTTETEGTNPADYTWSKIQGPAGPTIQITPSAGAFTFTDGVANPSSQTITLTANLLNTSETVTWSTSPSVTLGGSGTTRTLDLAAFGSNRQVVVTVTGNTSGASYSMVIPRLERWTSLNGLDPTSYNSLAAIQSRAMSGDNLIRNANLQANTSFWTLFTNGVGGSTVPARTTSSTVGDPPVFWTGGSVGGGLSIAYPQSGLADAIQAEPGKFYKLEFLAKDGPVTAYLQFFDAAGNDITPGANSTGVTAGSSWILHNHGNTAPANAAHVYLQFYFGAGAKMALPTLTTVRNDALNSPIGGAVNRNPDIREVAADGRPAFWYVAASGAVDPTMVTWKDSVAKDTLLLNGSNTFFANSAFRVEPGTTYEVEVTVAGDGGAVNPANFTMMEYDSDLPTGKTYVGGYSSGETGFVYRTRQVDIGTGQNIPAVSGGYTTKRFTYTPTSTAKWASFNSYENTSFRLLLKRVYIRSKADLSRTLKPALPFTVNYDHTGTTAAVLPKVLQNIMLAGDRDVTSETSFSYSASGCTINTTSLTAGQVRVTAVSAINATITVTAVHEGVTRTTTIQITRTQDNPPGSSGGSGGAGATGFGPVPINTTITDTSWDGTPQELARGQMRSNASSQVRLSLSAAYGAGLQGSGTNATLNVKAQRSTDGTNWTDLGVSQTGTTATGSYYNNPPGEPVDPEDYVEGVSGAINYNALTSGSGGGALAASTDYYFRWIAYFTWSGVTSLGVEGEMGGSQT